MTKQKSDASRARSRRRRAGDAAANLRGINESHRRLVKASRRTYFALYAPRAVLTRLKTKDYWRSNRPKFLAAALIALFALSLYQLFVDDLFYVPQLTPNGNRILPASEIDHAAGIRGWNVFFVNGGDVEAAIKRLPEVKDAHVSVNLPNQVQVQIAERLPRFVWETRGGTFWVDDDGIALRARFNAPDLLSMKDPDNSGTKIGERVNADAFNAAVNLRNLWQNGPRAFEWSKAHGLAVRDDHGWLIYFGSASQMADKLAALKIVTAQLVKDQHAIAYIDVGSGLPYYQEVATKQ
jgi:cell division septal protein FtsQ